MNGAFIVSGDEDLFEQIERVLSAHGGLPGDNAVPVSGSDGTLFTVYGGTWVLDGNSVLWSDTALDPVRLSL